MALCLVRGTGDVGSAVAHALFCGGHRVVLHDAVAPTHSRRGMAFADAIFDGLATLGDVLAKRARDLDDLPYMMRCGRAVPVSRDNCSDVIDMLRPDVLKLKNGIKAPDERAAHTWRGWILNINGNK